MKEGTPVLVVRKDHPGYGCVGYIKARTSHASFGVCVFVPKADGYKAENYLLFKGDLLDLGDVCGDVRNAKEA